MKGDFLRIILDIIILIILVVLIYLILMALIGLSLGKELEYIGYLNTIVNDIEDGGKSQLFISNYDYKYVFVLTYNNEWYLQLYRCLPPGLYVGFLSATIVYWNVSTTDNGDTFVFAPALAFCKLVKQTALNNINQINITIQGLNDNAGLLALSYNSNLVGNSNLTITIPLTDNFFPPSPSLVIINDTLITCNNNGEECTFNSSSTGESGSISCAPSSNINSNNNLPYNPSECVELSGLPWNSEITLNNFVGEVTDSNVYDLNQVFQTDFPLLLFGGSLPPTAMYIYISSNPNPQDGTADINIYIGETVPTSS